MPVMAPTRALQADLAELVAAAHMDDADRPKWLAFGAKYGVRTLTDALAIIDTPALRRASARCQYYLGLSARIVEALESGDQNAQLALLAEAEANEGAVH